MTYTTYEYRMVDLNDDKVVLKKKFDTFEDGLNFYMKDRDTLKKVYEGTMGEYENSLWEFEEINNTLGDVELTGSKFSSMSYIIRLRDQKTFRTKKWYAVSYTTWIRNYTLED